MQGNKKYAWHKIASEKSDLIFPFNGLLQIQVAEKQVCMAMVDEALYACAAKCPHAGGLLGDGFIDTQNNLVCPLHRYRFNLQNGRNVSGEGYYLKTYPVEQRADGIYVGLEISPFLSWF